MITEAVENGLRRHHQPVTATLTRWIPVLKTTNPKRGRHGLPIAHYCSDARLIVLNKILPSLAAFR
jgi:hypothetical protein